MKSSLAAGFRRRKWALLSLSCALTLALGACGGDDDDSSQNSAGSSQSSAGGRSLMVGGAPDTGGSNSSGAGPIGGSTQTQGGSAGSGTAGSMSAGSATGGGGSGGGSTGSYLPCASAADCKVYGGGKICCAESGMQFCTKSSGCSGKTLP